MSEVRIAAEPRTEFGKGASRRARRAGKVPAVLYGHGTEPRHLNLPGHELMLALKTPNVLLRLEGLDKDNLALPKSIQRDAIKGFLEHVDLLVVSKGEKVEVEIPVTLVGEIKGAGVLTQELVTVTVEAEATHIPEGVEFDIDGLDVGSTVTAAELKLPAGTTLVTDPESIVLNVSAPRVEEEGETPAEGEAAEGEATEAAAE
ncbi:50S ribosomal protein L25/general stress protein Ctc [Nocardiopsis changdeensis]|uniref:Large ribosomal subunit protein bL25 n=1 Tax=Nocardiopsis changdeensis TaxID=2831969 RepID=A0ABX8BPL8_9ACTN|nr:MULTISPECIES: 50S ribosomal protein L25/general stress protein Ctc [Nocardiopsis]QUX23643.1 50S ribosomal protein L25/general stress protein Ctc [Nocardiopsis changdeensis]QYX39586.1 50S ribosomal protein L25/general stress protein Ctc [Nocardiopsis sp. MT53]